MSMLITCPTCATRYTVSAASVGPEGRKVRCAKCGHTWQQYRVPERSGPETRMMDDEATELRMPTRETRSMGGEARGKGRGGRRLPVGWIAFGVVLAGIVAGGLLARAAIVDAWPPSARLYALVGLPVDPPGAGLKLQGVRSEHRVENGAALLIVEGRIVNDSDRERAVPKLRAVTLDAEKKPLKSWTIEPSQTGLLPGEVAIFQSAEADPGAAAEVMISFEGE